jgi:tetratricopeptide (TPR) repeat protein
MATQEPAKAAIEEQLGPVEAAQAQAAPSGLGVRSPRIYSRESILIVCVVLLVLMFGVTAFVSRQYHKKIHGLADQSFAQGEASFEAGHYSEAVSDFRNALVYSPNNSDYQFHLAQALASAGEGDQARSYLLNLLSESPGSGQINLALARIAAHEGAESDAVGYYQRAIYGVWEQNPLAMRWQVRRELSEYLLDLHAINQAEPELIALASEVPPGDADRLKTVGGLTLRAGLWERALESYRSVLKSDPRDEDALAGAGTAAYQLGQYQQAIAYLERLSPERRADPRLATILQTARGVESADPSEPGISTAEKAQRTVQALSQAESRLADCAHSKGISLSSTPADTDMQKLYATSLQMSTEWSDANLRRYPVHAIAAMSLVFQMEDAATAECGAPQPGPDNTLSLIARSSSGMPPGAAAAPGAATWPDTGANPQ